MKCCDRTGGDEVNWIVAGESRQRVDVYTIAKHGMLMCRYREREERMWSHPFSSSTEKNSGYKGLKPMLKDFCRMVNNRFNWIVRKRMTHNLFN